MSKSKDISTNVLNKIKKGEVKMRPGIYFTILSSLIMAAILAAGLALAYLSSIIFFWLRIINSSSRAYGAQRNLSEAIASFPWWTIVAFVGLVLLAIFLVHKYGTMYKHKIRYIVLLIILTSLIAGFTMSNFGIGDINHSGQNGQGQSNSWRNYNE